MRSMNGSIATHDSPVVPRFVFVIISYASESSLYSPAITIGTVISRTLDRVRGARTLGVLDSASPKHSQVLGCLEWRLF